METLQRVLRWLSFGWRRKARESELDAELRFHLEAEAAEREADGLAPGEARRAASLDLGNSTSVKEATREAWGWATIESWMDDLRYGARTLRKNPAFALAAVASLALGIGANTAVFSVVNAVLLRTLPVKDPRELVGIRIAGKSGGAVFTNPQWEAIRDSQDALAGALAYGEERFDLAEGGESRFVRGLFVSGGYFDVLGVPALRGRVITSRDDRHGCGADGPVAVIGYDFWRNQFQEDPGVVGRALRLNHQAFTIVGVTPPWMKGLNPDLPFDVAVPIGCEPRLRAESALDQRSYWWLRLAGRLKPGASLAKAQSRMSALAPEIFRATVPSYWSPGAQQNYRNYGLALSPAATGFSEVGEFYRTALVALLAIAGLVLLIACANIANLLLARAAARQRELSMRMAIGACRWRLVRQLLTESLLLSGLGACGGLLLALWGNRTLVRLILTAKYPVEIDLAPDLHLLAFTAAVTVGTALAFGLAPALRATRLAPNDVLKEHGRGAVGGASRFRLGRSLAAAQIAVSFILLLAAGLFIGTLRNLLNADLGFRPGGVLLVTADIQHAAKDPAQRLKVYDEILDRLRKLPGVTSASNSYLTPLGEGAWNEWIASDGYGASPRPDALLFMNRVSPGYFRTMGTPLVAGRDFDDHDGPSAPPAMVINESAARQFFGPASALGKTIRVGDARYGTHYHVVGVVRGAKYQRVDEPPPITGFVAIAQYTYPWVTNPSLHFELRHTIPASALTPAVRAAIAQVSADISPEFRGLATQVDESLQQQRLVAALSTLFGALALLLSMVGLYGVTAYSVARRKAEIGLRMALGARTGSVLWLILRDVAALLLAGTALGVLGALMAGRLLASLLYGVRPNDPLRMLVTAAVLALAATLAAALPAWRAARLDPMKVLRVE
ncbi:MAG: ADOP family duplicated permease [Bryobacteraceae bacterium]